MRKGWLLDDQAVHSPGILPDLALGVILALMLVGVSAYLCSPEAVLLDFRTREAKY